MVKLYTGHKTLLYKQTEYRRASHFMLLCLLLILSNPPARLRLNAAGPASSTLPAATTGSAGAAVACLLLQLRYNKNMRTTNMINNKYNAT